MVTGREGKTSEGHKAHGRFGHEIRPEGQLAEQHVKRQRKSEGVAQPGEVNLVLVAALLDIAEGSRNLTGGHSGRFAQRNLGNQATLARLTPDKDVWSNTLNVRPRARESRR